MAMVTATITCLVAPNTYANSPAIWGAPYPIMLGRGGMRFKNSDTTTTCNTAAAGSLRYNAGTFEGCNGSAWSSLAGGTTYTADQYGVALSSATNATLTILAPDASTTKVLTSGGAAANPSWQAIGNATTATALAADPADCSAGQYATTIA